MKILITSILLASALSACSGGNGTSSSNGVTPASPVSAHQQLFQSLTGFENSSSVVSRFFGSLVPPSFSDPNLQKMVEGLKTCAYKPDGLGGGTLSGTQCPITFTQTEAITTTSMTTTQAYKVVDATFQTYSPVQTFTVTANNTDLGTNLGGSISLTITATTANEASMNVNESIVVSPTQSNGQYTVTYQATVKSTTDNASLSASVTAHNDAHGTPVVDGDTCMVDNAAVNCSAIKTFSDIVQKVEIYTHHP